MMGRFWQMISVGLVTLLVVGCAPQTAQVSPLPTIAPTATQSIALEDAEFVANLFLDSWQKQDFVTMYQTLSFQSQEATPYEQFVKFYTDAQNIITMKNVTYTPRSLYRESDRIVVFHYDALFTTNILGNFEDTGRDLRLTLDRASNRWQVAWSLGDIFPEMGNGAVLRFESSIPRRANIYDRNGDILADQNGVMVDVNVIPKDIPDITLCLNAIAEATDSTPADAQNKLSRGNSDWVINVGVLEPPRFTQYQTRLETACKATFAQKAIRRYPRGSLMPNILGHVGYPTEAEVPDLVRLGFNAETIIGRAGIERSWDSTLRGQPGGRLSLVAPSGTRLRILAETTSVIPESLWLTIDAEVQEYVLQVLGEAYLESAETWGQTSKGASAIVFDVNTGEILAMVSYPSYEGNALNPFPAVGRTVANDVLKNLAENPANPLLNRATQGIYPAGSVMKAIDALAVGDSNIYGLDKVYACSGVWQQENDRRFDWLAGGHGRVTIASALTQSCNPFFYQVGFDMNAIDPFLLPNYARRFGFGAVTGLRDLSEASGTIPDPDWIRINRGIPWTFSHSVSMAIGQGEVEVTPLQMVRFYAGIGHPEGTLYRPQLVLEKGILDARTFLATPEANGALNIRDDVLAFVRQGLCDVTTAQYGTASHIFRNSPLLSIGVCAKTGTAQASGSNPPHSWFTAYAPKNNPQIATVVMVENAGDGSAIAAPITRRILEWYFFIRAGSQ